MFSCDKCRILVVIELTMTNICILKNRGNILTPSTLFDFIDPKRFFKLFIDLKTCSTMTPDENIVLFVHFRRLPIYKKIIF